MFRLNESFSLLNFPGKQPIKKRPAKRFLGAAKCGGRITVESSFLPSFLPGLSASQGCFKDVSLAV